ncbi:MAG: cupin domain-containing protein [Gallionella sp.]|nr:cupin domain-containing protein [Gallionella sp.]MDD4959332.1 cupin domain-containing protein [Gallionella sp.]
MNALITALQLQPHPEGGWYREIFRSPTSLDTPRGKRAALTTIFYLLGAGQISRWHVVESDEIWHFYAGTTLELFAYDPQTRSLTTYLLGDLQSGGQPVAIIPAGVWQAARVQSGHALMGCTVAPGFEFSDFRFVADLPDYAGYFTGELEAYMALL